MKTKSKIKLANLSTWIMVITISIIAIWFIGFIVANTFDLNVFAQRTSNFIYSLLGFSAVLVMCSAILNISLNISMIADSNIKPDDLEKGKLIGKKFYLSIIIIVIALVAFMFLGDFSTRKNEKDKLINASDYITKTYSKSIEKIAVSLTDTSQVKNIPEILNFLSNLKSEFPSVLLITSGKYEGQLTFLEINTWEKDKDLKEPLFGNSFYKCEEYDCEYLHDFFTGKSSKTFFWTKQNDYKLYYPFDIKGTKFILLFSKFERSGRIGS